jgi:hypothetical protein
MAMFGLTESLTRRVSGFLFYGFCTSPTVLAENKGTRVRYPNWSANYPLVIKRGNEQFRSIPYKWKF